MTIPDIIYALHEHIITRDEARHLIDALAHMELSVSLEAPNASLEVDVSYGRSPEEMRRLVAMHDANKQRQQRT